MSVLGVALAIDQDAPDPLAKLILILMGNRHHSDTGLCTLSVERICLEAGCSYATALRKLTMLEEAGLVRTIENTDPASGRRLPNSYILPFIPSPAEIAAEAEPRERTRASLPPRDWTPSAESVAAIRERYPNHDTSQPVIDYITTEFIDFCHAKNQRYARLDAAWRNSARRTLERRTPGAAGFRASGGERRGSAGVFHAVRDLLSDTGS